MYPGIFYLQEELSPNVSGLGFQCQAGIVEKERRLFCFRCGNNDANQFGTTFQGEKYCRNCLMMKRITVSTQLCFRKATESERVYEEQALNWKGALSTGQEKGSLAVLVAIQKRETLLLWAVAGSGKTEMTFAGLEEAFRQGLRVCFASPRVDVCIELLPRFKEVFPNVPLVCLYGDSKDRFRGESFVIATTHQLIRFYQYFDVVFIDEVDAFPYAKDPFLEYAVKKALADGGIEIYMTATPERSWQIDCLNGKRNYVKIPARYHRHPLPVPKTIWIGNWARMLRKNKISKKSSWLDRKTLSSGQAYLAVLPQNRSYACIWGCA
ncbi:competence protein ComFA [Listeria floridensis FSL S10-1187]|uniref:Competence protein ComFA n=1 Tax=Listeria floridensis FSL S10-1187 TaxID=1265817 RepID=A0ABP3AWS3_9LIST|nr:DEAD/DEAH box helicase family protein [Listeria floridensis]EUJ27929.1 competence protein ComFA [Listeria floridensis FSL S10-1187]